MASSGILRRLALVRTDVSEELNAPFIRVTRIGELGTTLALTSIVPSSSILVTLMKEALSSSETSVLTRAIRRNILEDVILLCNVPVHRKQNINIFLLNYTCLLFLSEPLRISTCYVSAYATESRLVHKLAHRVG
jgi:hypothetical protein